MRNMLILFLLLLPVVHGATIHGGVYDFSLQKVDNVKVEINTEPIQRDITENGEYAFDVNIGEYILRAEQLEDGMLISMAEEKVVVKEEGDFVVDIILFPELDQPVNLPEIDEKEISPSEKPGVDNIIWFIALCVGLFVLCYILKRSHHEVKTSGETEELITFLKRQGGRATQKEIRKAFPHSEAKTSLLLTELENDGKLKKIKKGRGNIIVLQ